MSEDAPIIIKLEDRLSISNIPVNLGVFRWFYGGSGDVTDSSNWYKEMINGQILPAETEVHPLVEKTHSQLVLEEVA